LVVVFCCDECYRELGLMVMMLFKLFRSKNLKMLHYEGNVNAYGTVVTK